MAMIISLGKDAERAFHSCSRHRDYHGYGEQNLDVGKGILPHGRTVLQVLSTISPSLVQKC